MQTSARLGAGVGQIVAVPSMEQFIQGLSSCVPTLNGTDIAYEVFDSEAYKTEVRSVTGLLHQVLDYPQAQHPMWAPDGKSLYFLVDGDGIYQVPVTTEPFFDVRGEPQRVVGTRSAGGSVWFDISPDGNTLVISASSIDADLLGEQKNYSTLVWWQNWAQSLSKD